MREYRDYQLLIVNMDIWWYLLSFLLSFVSSVFGIMGVLFLTRHIFQIAETRQGTRHIHARGVTRFGGVVMVISFLLVLVLNPFLHWTLPWYGFAFLSLLTVLIGLKDDRKEVKWILQLCAQLSIASAAFAFGIRLISITNPFGKTFFFDASGWMMSVSFIITVLWIVGVMNAVNWSDGVDGLCGGIAFVGFITLFVLSLRPEVWQPSIALASLALAGSVLGFLVFNFYPARIVAGTSGSWFLGFSLAVLAIFSGAKVATTVLVLAVPLLDAAWVVFDRWRSGVSIFHPDERHLHHRLRRMGWSTPAITLLFYLFTLLLAVLAIHISALGKVIVFVCVGSITLILFASMQRRSSLNMMIE